MRHNTSNAGPSGFPLLSGTGKRHNASNVGEPDFPLLSDTGNGNFQEPKKQKEIWSPPPPQPAHHFRRPPPAQISRALLPHTRMDAGQCLTELKLGNHRRIPTGKPTSNPKGGKRNKNLTTRKNFTWILRVSPPGPRSQTRQRIQRPIRNKRG